MQHQHAPESGLWKKVYIKCTSWKKPVNCLAHFSCKISVLRHHMDNKSNLYLWYTGIAQEGIIGEGQPGTSKVKCDGWSLVEKKRTHFLYLSSSRSVSLPLPSSLTLSLSQSLFLTLSPSLSHSLSQTKHRVTAYAHTHRESCGDPRPQWLAWFRICGRQQNRILKAP